MSEGEETLTNRNFTKLIGFLFLLALFSGVILAQNVLVVTPKPKVKTAPKTTAKTDECDEKAAETQPSTTNDSRFQIPDSRFQTETPPTPQIFPPAPMPTWDDGKKVVNEDDVPVEKFIAADANVNINLCVSNGIIRINGWEREEVRVFVSGGSKAGFRVGQINKKSNKPASLTVLGYDPKKDKGSDLSACLFGDEIELDVPVGARINKLKGGETTITINHVAKVLVFNENGDISLNGIEEGVVATTYEGDISVENSSGAMTLETTNGNIFAYKTEPLEAGDALTAKTNGGSVILQAVNHSVVSARSISSWIRFTGEIQPGGQYRFENTSGQILLGIPKDSNCVIEVISHKDRFIFDVPLKITSENVYPPSMKKVVGTVGNGEANINLVNQTGRIWLKKIN
jgi:hypothetical protein